MLILKGIGKANSDGWKDATKRGDVVFVHAEPLPKPYVGFAGQRQYERVGNIGWTASDDQYWFEPASRLDVLRLFPSIVGDWFERRRLYRFRRASS